MPDDNYWSTITLQTPISDEPYEREAEFNLLAERVVSNWKNWSVEMTRDKLRSMTRTEIRRWLFHDWSSDLNDYFTKDEVVMLRKLAGVTGEESSGTMPGVQRAVNRHNGREALVYYWHAGYSSAFDQVRPAIKDMYADFPKARAAARESHWAVMYQTGMGPAWAILTDSEFLVAFDVVG